MEIKSVIEDCRADFVGGIQAGLNLWEGGVIPMILNNSGTWIDIKKTTMKTLEDLQLMMLRYVFKALKTTPSLALWWDGNLTPMNIRIEVKK